MIEIQKQPTTVQSQYSNKRLLREESILNAATEVFVQKGYELATTKEIAANANCAEGLIFKYFSGKANLLGKLLERGISRAEQELLELPENLDSVEEDLSIFMEWTIRIYWNERKIFQIYFAQRLRGEINLHASTIRESFIKKRKEIFINRISKHQEKGHLSKEINYDNIYMSINSFAIYICILQPSLSPQSEIDIYKNAKDYIKNLTHGIKIH